MTERSFGGYAYQQRLGTGVFGELYRALSRAGVEARILHVDPRLAARPGFARALVQFGECMVPLHHPHVVGLRQVGTSGEHLVVVTDPVSAPVTVAELRARSGGRLPIAIALAIGRAAVEGLAFAHSLRVVHGAVHPRSVLVDFHGGVALADFGVSWALVATAAERGERALLHDLDGFLAPEVAAGRPASEASDVYAAGALLFDLLSVRPPPGQLDAPRALRRAVERALSGDPAQRLINGSELEELLEEAIAAHACPPASPAELARFVGERLAAADDALHSETDDLVAGLPLPPAPRRSARVTDVLAELDEDSVVSSGPTESAVDGVPTKSAGSPVEIDRLSARARSPATRARRGQPRRALVAEEKPRKGKASADRDVDLTEVDPHDLRGDPDLSGLLRLGELDALDAPGPEPAAPAADDRTPLPRPEPHRPGSVTSHLIAPDPVAPGEMDLGPVADSEATARHARPRGARALLWTGATVFVLGALAMFVQTQTDLFDPGRRARAAEAADREALARHRASQPVPADITITAAEPDAAVWLLLGRTPIDSPPLSAAMVHELRVEHEGYRPQDVRVTGYQWVEDAGSLRAHVAAELVPAAADSARVAASPPPSAAPAGPRGRGVLHVESHPPGAQVWLLVGFTPRATVSGLEAGRDYQLKVMKDGFRPGRAAIRAEEWRPSGPRGPVAASQSRDVALTPVSDGQHRKSRKRDRE